MPRAARSSLPLRLGLSAFLVALFLWLAGCSSGLGPGASWRSKLQVSLATQGLDPAAIIVPFDVTPAGRSWLAEQPPPSFRRTACSGCSIA